MQDLTYFFVLGRNPALSIAEILAVLEQEQIRYKISGYSREVLLIDAPEDMARIFPRLGGSIKFGKIIDVGPRAENLLEFLPSNIKKVYFGFSFYKFRTFSQGEAWDKLIDDTHGADLEEKQKELRRLAMEVKKMLRARGQSARFVTSRERVLSSVIVKTNKLLQAGVEFVFLIPPSLQFNGSDPGTNKTLSKNMLVGKTISVQEFEDYEARDYGRPRRDILRGMLPPKIAKIMINLAGISGGAKILDPFCGVGTILAEAAVLGYKNLIGQDRDPQAIADAKINLEWIKKQYNVSPQINFFIVDARGSRTSSWFHGQDRGTIDAIVTEPYLGPLLRGQVEEKEILKIKKELEDLYRATFANFEKILKPNGRIVFIFPVWRTPSKNIFINLDKVLPQSFKIKQLLPAHIALPDESPRGGIIWQRPDQKVLREIIILRLKTKA